MTRFHEFINQQTSRASPCTSRQALRVWGTPRVRFSVFLPNSAVMPWDTKLTGPRRCVSRATAVHCAAGRWLGSKDDGWGGSSKLVCFSFFNKLVYIYIILYINILYIIYIKLYIIYIIYSIYSIYSIYIIYIIYYIDHIYYIYYIYYI